MDGITWLPLLLVPTVAFGHILDTTCLTSSPTGYPVVYVDYYGVVSGFDSDGVLSYRRAANTRNYEKYNKYPPIGSSTCVAGTAAGPLMEACGYFENVNISPIPATVDTDDIPFSGDRVRLSASDGNKDERKELRFGVFHCIASKNDQTVFSTVTVMSNEADFQPSSFTITANLEDSVTIKMSPYNNIDQGDINWRHIRENTVVDKHAWTGNISPVIAKVGLTDAGVYEAYKNNSNEDPGGYIRLIVRGCRYNLWGSSTCEWTCPVCYNGGICDDVTGACICPPGFTGDQCEKVCPSGFIGRHCDTDCFLVTEKTDCRGVEICLSDPFGCTCAPGYTGLACTTECPDGYYGAGCTQVCHCSGSSTCDHKTGACDSGACNPPWGGPMCQVKVLDVHGFGNPAAVNVNKATDVSIFEAITTLAIANDAQMRIGREFDTQTGVTGSGISNQDVDSNIASGDSGLPSGSLTFGNNNDRGGNVLQLESSNNDIESLGVFYAEAISNQRREHIALLRISNQLDVFSVAPKQYTWTVGTSESVTLEVTVSNQQSTNDLQWRHNGRIIQEADGQNTFTIAKTRKADEGVYECSLQNQPNGSQAIMLLKVRSCPSGKWGIYCNNTCPDCYYQGICHDETGECICQAGYTGSDCSQPCSEASGDRVDLFGQSCSLRCGNQRCRYKQICSPDPIGCHCRAGFGGNIRCSDSCQDPYFGPDCSMEAHCGDIDNVIGCASSVTCDDGYGGPGCQEINEGLACNDGLHGKLCNKPCHCANSQKCNRITGSCDDDVCEEGWGGSDCGNALPYLLSSPVTNITDDEVQVSWELWRVGIDYGTGPVSLYQVNYAQTNTNSETRQFVMSTPSSVTVSGYTVELEGLDPLEEYTVSVSPVKVIDGVETAGPGSPSTSVTSECGKPYYSPTIVSITSPNEAILKVTWQISNPPRRWMDCTPSIIVFYKDTGGQEKQLANIDTSETETEITNLQPCVTYNISLAVEYNNGKIGVRSEPKTALTNASDPTIKPDQPTTQRLNGTNPIEFSVSWTSIGPDLSGLMCDPSTGFFYQVKWRLSSGDMNIQYAEDVEENENTYTVSENLEQCSQYEVTIAVKNAGEKVGPDSDISFVRTDSDEPTAVPNLVELYRLQGTNPVSLEARWEIEALTKDNLKCDPTKTDYDFKVYYHPVDDTSSVKFREVPSNQTEVTIATNLEQCTLYNVYVTIRNVVLREGAQSSPETERTDSEDPTATPSNFKVEKVPGTSNIRINASWQIDEINQENLKCDPNKTEYTFEVYYRRKGVESNTKTISVPGSSTTAIIDDDTLLLCTDYEVYVTLKNTVERESERSSIETVITDSEEHTTEVMFTASRIEGTEPVRIQVMWSTEELSEENLKCDPGLGYTVIVRYNVHGDASLVGEEEISDESTNSVILSENLISCTEYDVYVDIMNAAGRESNNMDSAQPVITDSEEVTLKPVVKAKNATATSINLSWELEEEASEESLKCNLQHPYQFVLILESPDGNGTAIVLEQTKQTFEFVNLTEDTTYTVFVRVRNFAGRMGPSEKTEVTTEATTNPLAIAMGVTVPILLIIFLLLLVFFVVLPRRGKKPIGSEDTGGLDFIGFVPDEKLQKNENTTDLSPLYANAPEIQQNTCIPVKDLPKVVKAKKMSNAGFREEYEKLLSGNYRQCEVGKKQVNQEKNRFKNIITYDHSRVKLPIINDDPHSDYINASYIDGYDKRNAFIASQGPNKASLVDFWRMMCNERCTKIIMVTNLTESGKVKCLKYWPDVNETQTYSTVNVKTVAEKQTNEVVTRRFKVFEDSETLEVTQYHYIGWPDMKVPQSADALWDILDEAEKNETAESPPIVVHCSAGCGRTGTIIALSSLRKMMKAENKVDIFKSVNEMRKQRTTMVQVCDQYQFIFESLLIYSHIGKTSVKVDEFETTLRSWKANQNSKALSQSKLNKQFNILKYISPFPKPTGELAGSLPQNTNKNRYPDLIPLNRFRPNLMTEVEDGEATNYINASFCDGYSKRDLFLSTQAPLSNTIVDFWRMVYDYECFTIVVFEPEPNKNCPDYWPAEGNEEHYGPFVVSTQEQENDNNVTRRDFHLSLSRKKPSDTQQSRVVTQYTLKHSSVSSASAILSLVEKVDIHHRQTDGKRIAVQSLDGVRECSMFMAIYNCCDRLRQDGVVDLFTVVRGLRERRPEMVETLEQYEFCLDTIKEHLTDSNVYANI